MSESVLSAKKSSGKNPTRENGIKTRIKKLLKQMWRCKALYLMILPGIITVFIFHYIPIYGVQIAFKDYRTGLGILGSEWVGLKHFIKFVQYPYFWDIIRNTVMISLASICTFPCSVIFALMLNEMKNGKLKKICQQITYAPYFVSTVVICSMTIMFLNTEGLINILIGFLGIDPIDFMSKPAAFAPIYALTGLWNTLGWGTIIYMASLSGVSPELIESAKIDGATRLQIICHINWPHLKPTVIMLFIMELGKVLNVGFEKAFLLQNPLNLEASSVISTYTYQVGIGSQQFSYSAAIGLFNNIVTILLVLLANKISKKVADIGLW